MNTLLTRVIPLLLLVLVGTLISWMAFYAWWFGVWIFHSVPAARTCVAVGDFILLPARHVFGFAGGDQSTIFADPFSFSGTNGLVLGMIMYILLRSVIHWRAARRS